MFTCQRTSPLLSVRPPLISVRPPLLSVSPPLLSSAWPPLFSGCQYAPLCCEKASPLTRKDGDPVRGQKPEKKKRAGKGGGSCDREPDADGVDKASKDVAHSPVGRVDVECSPGA
eukprot:309280-Rhodomonas_salina.2